jgi:hypothetical protein
MRHSDHYSRSIPETINTAYLVKNIKLVLLTLITVFIVLTTFQKSEIVITRSTPDELEVYNGDRVSDSTMASMAFYYSSRLGNVSINSIKEMREMLKRVLPYEKIPQMNKRLMELRNTFEKTNVSEIFIPKNVQIHKGMGRVWVVGQRYIYVNGKEYRNHQSVKEFEFGIKRGFVYPTYSVQYSGGSKMKVQISAWLKEKE